MRFRLTALCVLLLPCGVVWAQHENGGEILLKYARFDPVATAPAVPPDLAAGGDSGLWIVQFTAAPLAADMDALAAAGGERLFYIPRQAALVRADADARARIAALPCVRWVGPYHPAYRLAREDQFALRPGAPAGLWNVVAIRKHDLGTKERIAAALVAAGGALHFPVVRESFRLTMRLPPEALLAAIRHDEVAWVDPWSPPEADMNIARADVGANYVAAQTPTAFEGAGVRGEVPDIGCLINHQDFPGALWHSATHATSDHGTSTFGIVFGKGIGQTNARGLLPLGQGYAGLVTDPLFQNNRYAYTAELLTPPYECVFQSNSTGAAVTASYTSDSMLMDDIVFDLDLAIFQSQSNTGSTASRPEAWAKNVVSVGGIRHMNTITRTDDHWSGGGSIGPAADGRIKPDLSHFYDGIFTTSGGPQPYTSSFAGTSAATPIVAGCAGLTIEMWAGGILGPVNAGPTVFARRPHAATTKALLINNADSYSFSGTNDDLTRTHQGWGTPDLQRTYDRAVAGKWLVIDETLPLPPLQSASFLVSVSAGEPDLRATLVWRDPAGLPAAAWARVNDLDLRLTSPAGTTYRGNHGLLTGNTSVPGGSPNAVDTVENVFVANPTAGTWTITVFAAAVNEDAWIASLAPDVAFALVVTGGTPIAPGAPDTGQANSPAAGLMVNGGLNVQGQNPTNGVAGPFFASAPAGGLVAMTWWGPPSSPAILLAGPLRRNNLLVPGVGSLDLGLLGPGSITDVLVLIDGYAMQAPVDALGTTGPTGVMTLAAALPPMPPGVLTAFQVVIVPPAGLPVLSAACELSIN